MEAGDDCVKDRNFAKLKLDKCRFAERRRISDTRVRVLRRSLSNSEQELIRAISRPRRAEICRDFETRRRLWYHSLV